MIFPRILTAVLSVYMAMVVTAEDLNPRAPAPTPAETINPLSLGAIAASLYSEYYPSTTITNLADLTFPPTVVIGTQTVVLHSGTISTPKSNSASATTSTNSATTSDTNSGSGTTGALTSSDTTPTSTTTSNGASGSNSASQTTGNSAINTPSSSQSTTGTNKSTQHGLSPGQIAGIVVGTILGVALFALLLLCCLKRREKRSRKYHSKSTVHDKEPGTWFDPVPRDIPPPHAFHDGIGVNSNRRSAERNGHVPEMVTHHYGAGHDPHQRMSGQNPFFSEEERAAAERNGIRTERNDRLHPNGLHSNGAYPDGVLIPNGMHSNKGMVPTAAALAAASHHHPSHSSGSQGRIPRRAVPNRSSISATNGPMSSPSYTSYSPRERSGMQDGLPPIVPARSSERRDSPKLHYPTRDEISQFDFSNRGSGQNSNPSIPQSCQCNECRPKARQGTNQNLTVHYQFD